MANYLDDEQRNTLLRLRRTWTWRTEWPTWLLIAVIYGGWFGVALHARQLGIPLALSLLVALSTWYMSLQHELLHGHPTRSPLINALFGIAPLAVWVPYGIYRDSHLRHHDDPLLTHPDLDPESYFVAPHAWRQSGRVMRTLLTARNTFVGRLVIGPAFSIAALVSDAIGKLARRDLSDAPVWFVHGATLAALMIWLDTRCGITPWLFAGVVGYGALALGSVRSFHEHRAAVEHEHRTVINEAGLFWRLLFLNNNYHVVHHDLPQIPWFALRSVYEASRQQYIARSGGFLVKGYSEWARQYAFAPVTHPVHVDHSRPIRLNPPTSARLAVSVRQRTAPLKLPKHDCGLF
jgi:fatty acid desaturase